MVEFYKRKTLTRFAELNQTYPDLYDGTGCSNYGRIFKVDGTSGVQNNYGYNSIRGGNHSIKSLMSTEVAEKPQFGSAELKRMEGHIFFEDAIVEENAVTTPNYVFYKCKEETVNYSPEGNIRLNKNTTRGLGHLTVLAASMKGFISDEEKFTGESNEYIYSDASDYKIIAKNVIRLGSHFLEREDAYNKCQFSRSHDAGYYADHGTLGNFSRTFCEYDTTITGSETGHTPSGSKRKICKIYKYQSGDELWWKCNNNGTGVGYYFSEANIRNLRKGGNGTTQVDIEENYNNQVTTGNTFFNTIKHDNELILDNYAQDNQMLIGTCLSRFSTKNILRDDGQAMEMFAYWTGDNRIDNTASLSVDKNITNQKQLYKPTVGNKANYLDTQETFCSYGPVPFPAYMFPSFLGEITNDSLTNIGTDISEDEFITLADNVYTTGQPIMFNKFTNTTGVTENQWYYKSETAGSDAKRFIITTDPYGAAAGDVSLGGTDDLFTDATCDTHSNTTVDHDSSAAIKVGQYVSGSGIPLGAYVASVTSATAFVLSAAATSSLTNTTLTFTTVNAHTFNGDNNADSAGHSNGTIEIDMNLKGLETAQMYTDTGNWISLVRRAFVVTLGYFKPSSEDSLMSYIDKHIPFAGLADGAGEGTTTQRPGYGMNDLDGQIHLNPGDVTRPDHYPFLGWSFIKTKGSDEDDWGDGLHCVSSGDWRLSKDDSVSTGTKYDINIAEEDGTPTVVDPIPSDSYFTFKLDVGHLIEPTNYGVRVEWGIFDPDTGEPIPHPDFSGDITDAEFTNYLSHTHHCGENYESIINWTGRQGHNGTTGDDEIIDSGRAVSDDIADKAMHGLAYWRSQSDYFESTAAAADGGGPTDANAIWPRHLSLWLCNIPNESATSNADKMLEDDGGVVSVSINSNTEYIRRPTTSSVFIDGIRLKNFNYAHENITIGKKARSNTNVMSIPSDTTSMAYNTVDPQFTPDRKLLGYTVLCFGTDEYNDFRNASYNQGIMLHDFNGDLSNNLPVDTCRFSMTTNYDAAAYPNTGTFGTDSVANPTYRSTQADIDTDNSAGSGTSFGSNPKILRANGTAAGQGTEALRIGMNVSGAGIAANSVITQIDSDSLFRVDNDTTATATDIGDFVADYDAGAESFFGNQSRASHVGGGIAGGHWRIQNDTCYLLDTNPASSNAIVFDDGIANVDGFTSKGQITIKGNIETAADPKSGITSTEPDLTRRELIYCSSRVLKVANQKGIYRVDTTEPLVGHEGDTLIAYLYGSAYRETDNDTIGTLDTDGGDANTCNTSVTLVEILGPKHIKVRWNGLSNSGYIMNSEKQIPYLMFSPLKYWLFGIIQNWDMQIENSGKVAFTAGATRSYTSACLTTAASGISEYGTFGATWNESKYSDTPTVTGAYENKWSHEPEETDTILDLNDYGFGDWDEESFSGGFISKNAPKLGQYNISRMNNIFESSSGRLEPGDRVDFIMAPFDAGSKSHLIFHGTGGNETVVHTNHVEKIPYFVTVFEDTLPSIPQLSVAPYEKDPFFPEFKFQAGDDDLWYGFIIVDDKPINSQYHGGILHIPLNEKGQHGDSLGPGKSSASHSTELVGTDVTDDEIVEASHGLVTGQQVVFHGFTNTTGVTAGQIYYVSETSNTTGAFRITTSPDGDASGNITMGGTDDSANSILMSIDNTITNKLYNSNSDVNNNSENANIFIGATGNSDNVPKYDVEGLAGYCLRFGDNTLNEYIYYKPVSGNTLSDLTDEMSVVVHVVPDADMAGSTNWIVKGDSNVKIWMTSAGVVNASVYSDTSVYVQLTSNAVAVDGETPSCIIVTFDKHLKSGNVKLFIDGKLQDQSGLKTAAGPGAGGDNWDHGADIDLTGGEFRLGNHSTNCFEGRIEELVVYKKCIYPVSPSDKSFVLTKPLSEIENASSKVYTGRLFMKDYHNIRGGSTSDVATSGSVSWSKAAFRLGG